MLSDVKNMGVKLKAQPSRQSIKKINQTKRQEDRLRRQNYTEIFVNYLSTYHFIGIMKQGERTYR